MKKRSLKTGIFGGKFTFTDLASQKLNLKNKKYYEYLPDLFVDLKNKKIDQAVIPIENRLNGIVSESIDLLFKSSFKINTEITHSIHHCLACLEKATKKDLKTVISHPQALAQSLNFLRKNFKKLKTEARPSTVYAAKEIVEKNKKDTAVICSKEAASFNNLKIIAEDIENQKNNFTKFYLISSFKKNPNFNLEINQEKLKTSIAFSFKEDKPGSLFEVFKVFKKAKLNLSRIISRPAPPKMGEYIFFLDFLGGQDEKRIQKTLKKVEKNTAILKVLGSYPQIN